MFITNSEGKSTYTCVLRKRHLALVWAWESDVVESTEHISNVV